jgi:hypothetical protein
VWFFGLSGVGWWVFLCVWWSFQICRVPVCVLVGSVGPLFKVGAGEYRRFTKGHQRGVGGDGTVII